MAAAAVVVDEIFDDDELIIGALLAEGNEDIGQEKEEGRHRVPVRVDSYVEVVVPLYNDEEFKSHFRMRRASVEVSSI